MSIENDKRAGSPDWVECHVCGGAGFNEDNGDQCEKCDGGMVRVEDDFVRYLADERDRWMGTAQRLQAEKSGLEASLRKYMEGGCVCPKLHNPNPKAVHWPACPAIKDGQIAELVDMLEELITATTTNTGHEPSLSIYNRALFRADEMAAKYRGKEQ